ncbi:MAG: S16 family serine protease [Actinomycetota bacterium]
MDETLEINSRRVTTGASAETAPLQVNVRRARQRRRITRKANHPRAIAVPIALGLRATLSAVLVVWPAFAVPLPLDMIAPGPAPTVTESVKVEGSSFGSSGTILVPTVRLFDRTTVISAIRGWRSPVVSVKSDEEQNPDDKSPEQLRRDRATAMHSSKQAAIVAALRQLGYPLEPDGALVAHVNTTASQSAGPSLQSGDVIVAVDGIPVSTPGEARDRISNQIRERKTVGVTARRSGALHEVRLGMDKDRTNTKHDPAVRLLPSFRVPVAVNIESQHIGGASAGLGFALAAVELLGPDDMTTGRRIAATGTIDFDGDIGAVGGIPQKVEAARVMGAKLLLVPKRQVDEAVRVARRSRPDERIQVKGVSTLSEAVRLLAPGASNAAATHPEVAPHASAVDSARDVAAGSGAPMPGGGITSTTGRGHGGRSRPAAGGPGPSAPASTPATRPSAPLFSATGHVMVPAAAVGYSVTRQEFRHRCRVPASQGIDAWVVELPALDRDRPPSITVTARPRIDAPGVAVDFYSSQCQLLSEAVADGRLTQPLPGGARYMVVTPHSGTDTSIDVVISPGD